MAEPKDGGMAFPGTRFEPTAIGASRTHIEVTYPGMTLRDWFAGQAMAAIIIGNSADLSAMTAGAAKDAYAVADALLEARK